MHAALKPQRGDLSIVKGRFIGAAPWVGLTLRHLLTTAGIDLIGDSVTIAPVPGTEAGNINFGVAAAKALEDRKIDGFWANGMGAEVAVQSGTGVIVLDVRRGDGPEGCFHYTMASIAAADRLIEGSPEIAADAVRAVVDAQRALKADPGLALQIGRKLFPPTEAALIGELIRRDLPFYDPEIPQQAVDGMICFARSSGLMERKPRYDEIVAERFSALWQ